MTSITALRSARILVVGAGFALLVGACGGDELPAARPVVTTATPAPTTTSPSPVTSTSMAPDAPDTSSDAVGEQTSTTTSVVPTTLADQSGTAARVQRLGDDGFLLGANLPWYTWGCDFGCGLGTPDGRGVSSSDVRDAVVPALERASAAGMNVVRWWVFPGEPWQITTDGAGLPTGIEDAVFDDFDAALELAEALDVAYVFTLFSAPSVLPEPWLTTEVGRRRLAEVLGGLFARYADDPRVLTWQLVNEPEWEIWNGVVELEDVQELVAEVSDSIHANSTALASIGSANLDGLDYWLDSDLDYLTAHWYDPMSAGGACAMCSSYSEVAARFDVDLPVVIGEFYAGTEIDLEGRLDAFYRKGYAGAWAWSLLPERTSDALDIDFEAAARFAEDHRDDLSPAPSPGT